MKRLLLLIVLAFGATAAPRDGAVPCEYQLASVEIVPTRVGFSDLVAKLKPGLRSSLEESVRRDALSLVDDGHGALVGMIFDRRPRRKAHGYFVFGRLEGLDFTIDRVAQKIPGYNHYRRVAQARDLNTVTVALDRDLLGCSSLEMSGSTQVKIGMKHRLALEPVLEFVRTAKALPVPYHLHPNRALFTVTDRDAAGELREFMIELRASCPHELVTAHPVD